ncbi:MAG: ATP-dependent Clp protease ATP-binding subunit [Pseudonocardiaceae bacterium]|nr:MAG: ATP-dependent Clp protease ATP-binding subunit [Pseudonocardiaceae bacterium]
MASDRPDFGPLDDIVERLIDNLGSTLGTSLGEPRDDTPRQERPAGTQPRAGVRTPRLDRFGRDLTAAAAAGELDPVIGRDDEIAQVLEVLARRTKNNPVLVGDPGVGKTAVVEGIAQRIADGDVPPALVGVRVVSLDLAGLVSGTRYRGDFEQRLTRVIDEVVAARRGIVLFVDELHAVVGAGAAEGGAMDAATIIKPALARGELQLVGATTVADYRRHIERDAALERRLAPVRVGEPTVAQTVAILRGLRARYEAHHEVSIDDAALVAAAELSDRHLTDRFLPDKAIDLVDRAGARARIRASRPTGTDSAHVEGLRRARDVAVDAEDYERALLLTREIEEEATVTGRGPGSLTVTADDVAAVLAESTGIPVARLTADDRRRLLDLEDVLHRRIVGQDEAVSAVADAVRSGRAGLAHPGRPVGSFLFLGPTGVGKTELARALADALFGSENALLRFDMSEYSDRAGAYRLVGAPPGHAGFDEPGQLTEAVRRTPYAVVLFDEIEKAHAEVVATLLQVLDAGRLTDSHGRTVDFTRAVVVMTSNLGAPLLPGIGDPTRETLLAAARMHFRPEFLNRVDDVVPFHALGEAELRTITGLLLAETTTRLAVQGITLDVADGALSWLARHGHEPGLGARPLRRTIVRELERRLARMVIAGDVAPGGRVRVDAASPEAPALTMEVVSGVTGHGQ